MKKNIKLKILIDLGMTCTLLASMSYLLIGEKAHEWIGMSLLFLFLFHQILNYRWYQTIFHGTYTIMRIIHTIINILMLASILGLAVSSVILSRYIFDFLPNIGLTPFCRKLHMVSAYWGVVLMAAHLGLHWNMIPVLFSKTGIKIAGKKKFSLLMNWIGLCIAIYGCFAFHHYDLFSYMFLKKQFVFFDINRPLPLFFLDYLSIMGTFIWLFHRKRHCSNFAPQNFT